MYSVGPVPPSPRYAVFNVNLEFYSVFTSVYCTLNTRSRMALACFSALQLWFAHICECVWMFGLLVFIKGCYCILSLLVSRLRRWKTQHNFLCSPHSSIAVHDPAEKYTYARMCWAALQWKWWYDRIENEKLTTLRLFFILRTRAPIADKKSNRISRSESVCDTQLSW